MKTMMTSSSWTRIQKIVLQRLAIILILVIWSSVTNDKLNALIYREIVGSHLWTKSGNNKEEHLHNMEMVWWDSHPQKWIFTIGIYF